MRAKREGRHVGRSRRAMASDAGLFLLLLLLGVVGMGELERFFSCVFLFFSWILRVSFVT